MLKFAKTDRKDNASTNSEVVTYEGGEYKRTVYRQNSIPTHDEYTCAILNTIADNKDIREQIVPENRHIELIGNNDLWRNDIYSGDNSAYVHPNHYVIPPPTYKNRKLNKNKKISRKSKSFSSVVVKATTLDLRYGELAWRKPVTPTEATSGLTSIDVNENFSTPLPQKKNLKQTSPRRILSSDSSLESLRAISEHSDSFVFEECKSVCSTDSVKHTNKRISRFSEMRQHVKKMWGGERKRSKMVTELHSVSVPDEISLSEEDFISPLDTDINANIPFENLSLSTRSDSTSPSLSVVTPHSSSQSLVFSDRSFSDSSNPVSDDFNTIRRRNRKNCLRRQLYGQQKLNERVYLEESVKFQFDNNNDTDTAVLKQRGHISCLKADLLVKIFSYLNTRDICQLSKVCRKWYQLYLSLELWNTMSITNFTAPSINDIVNILLQRLSFTSPYACLCVKTVQLDGCTYLEDETLNLIAMKCPELKSLEVSLCLHVSGAGVAEILANCPNMTYMNLTGCDNVTEFPFALNLGLKFGQHASFLELRYVDLSECTSLHDKSLRTFVQCASFIEYLYIRRCDSVSNDGIAAIAENCKNLKEISLNECYNVSDIGVIRLVKSCTSLRYISLAKCPITDVSVHCMAKNSKTLRHLNLHECENLTDKCIKDLCICCDKLRSIDISKCPKLSNCALYALANCRNLRRLCLKGCTNMSDAGLRKVGTSCKKLRHLNIRDCFFSMETFIYINERCKLCTIEHNRVEF